MITSVIQQKIYLLKRCSQTLHKTPHVQRQIDRIHKTTQITDR